MKSKTLGIYKKWLATATPEQVAVVDTIYAACEEHYDQGGDVIVETYEPSDVLELQTVEAARDVANLHNERARDARWGEDSDPELKRAFWLPPPLTLD